MWSSLSWFIRVDRCGRDDSYRTNPAAQEQNLVLEIVNSHRDDEVIVRERAKLLRGEIVNLFCHPGSTSSQSSSASRVKSETHG